MNNSKAFNKGYEVVADCWSDQSNPYNPSTDLVNYQEFNSGKLSARIDQQKENDHRINGAQQ